MKFSWGLILLNTLLCLNVSVWSQEERPVITPNQFEGTDTERIQQAVLAAQETTGQVIIPAQNENGSQIWLLDSAILLPSDITIILENCTLQLSDQCRDNMFRSDNVGEGITHPQWNKNTRIIGIGNVVLKGADNPRATGDSHRVLVLDPRAERKAGNWRVSYGSDAGREGIKQKGDWRNIMILMGYVQGFSLENVTIQNAHAWAVSCERTVDAKISGIHFDCPETQTIDGKEVLVGNRDGIDLRHGCKSFHISDITGTLGDDCIALSILETHSENPEGGSLHSTMVTTRTWNGAQDDIDSITIENINCHSLTRAIAIRANDEARIQNVTINNVTFQGGYNAMLVGGRGYGVDSQPGKINNIHATNISGDGKSLIQIEEAISDCSFTNGVYSGDGANIILYKKIDSTQTSHVVIDNLVQVGKND